MPTKGSNPMLIANPIYDVVFKYLLADGKVAKMILSTILGEEIVELQVRPQEQSVEIESRSLTVLRIDFSAIIKTTAGTKLVIIEIQKAKFALDIMRFRRYLGEQYRNRDNRYSDGGKDRPIPIVSIYFLGYPLEHIDAPVVHVNRRYLDHTTGEELTQREPFIESLTHDSFIIQIPRLRPKRQSELEQLLMVFDQSSTVDNHKLLDIKEEDYPPKFHEVIRRLLKAASETSLRNAMDAEDDIIEDLQEIEREIAAKEEVIAAKEEVIAAKEEEIVAKKEVIAAKDEMITAKDEMITAKDEMIAEKDGRIAEKDGEIAASQRELAIRDEKILQLVRELAEVKQMLTSID